MKRLLAIFLAMLMVVSVFTACGEAKKSDNSDDKKTEPTAGDNNDDANNSGTNNGGLGGLGGLGGNNGGSTNSAIVGKYMIYSVTENGQTADYAQIIELGMDSICVVFNANGTFSMSAIEEDPVEGTYTDSTMTANGEERSYTFDGEKVVISFEGTSITFVREGSDLFENGGDNNNNSVNESPSIVGKYMLCGMIIAGEPYGYDAIVAAGVESSYVEFKADGTYVMAMTGEAIEKGSYNDGTITDSIGDTFNYSFDGTCVTMEIEGMTVMFATEGSSYFN